MLALDNVNEQYRVYLNAAHTTNPLHCVATWRDITTSTFVAGGEPVATNGTTPVSLVPSPAASTQRVIDFISVFNSDTTNKQVTISKYNGTSDFVLYRCVLGPDERVTYTDQQGFVTYNSAGAIKQIAVATNNAVSGTLSFAVLGADVANANATANTMADVGLSFPVSSGSLYWFEFFIHYTAAATTTGSRWSIQGPASPTELRYRSEYPLTGTTATINEGLAGYDLPATSNASSNASNVARVEGFIRPSAAGNVIARFASEIASSAITAKAGSFVKYLQLL